MGEHFRWQAIAPYLLSVIPWLFPDLTLKQKLFWMAIIIACSTFAYILDLHKQYKAAIKRVKELERNHSALAIQFDKKRSLENKYRSALDEVGMLLKIAVLDSDKAKIEAVYAAYVHTQLEISDGGN